MKTKLKYRLLRIAVVLRNLFKHDCYDYRNVTSKSFLKDGASGVVFALDVNCECSKCNKKWIE